MDVDRDMEIDRDRGTYIDMDINPAEIYADGFDRYPTEICSEGYDTSQEICSEGYPAEILSRRIIIILQTFVKGV
jgi:hypothetical protein